MTGYGQEINGVTFAICTADMLVQGGDPTRIVKGNSFTEGGFEGRSFDHMLSNSPFGVEWKKFEEKSARRPTAGTLAGSARASRACQTAHFCLSST